MQYLTVRRYGSDKDTEATVSTSEDSGPTNCRHESTKSHFSLFQDALGMFNNNF